MNTTREQQEIHEREVQMTVIPGSYYKEELMPNDQNVFSLTDDQVKKLNEWMETKDLDEYTGAAGGRFTYKFTYTGLGVVTKVLDNLHGDEIDLTDYDAW